MSPHDLFNRSFLLSKHNAPPVVYPLGRSRFQVQLLAGLWLVGLLVVAFWVATSQATGWRQGLGLATLVLAAAAMWAGWTNSAIGQLAWDGQSWCWESQGYQAGSTGHDVSVAFDFQSLMLLRLDNPAHVGLWLWAERRAFPERWLDLRRALYSPRRQPNSGSGLA